MSHEKTTVADGVVVAMEYVLTLTDGQEIDRSPEGEPLYFLQGTGQIIPGLEQELYDMGIGQEKTVVVAPADGYGEVDKDAIQLFPHETFPEDIQLEPGVRLRMRTEDGHPLEAGVAEVKEEGVLLDFNHPLAGETLNFAVKIVALRPATKEEQEHGHVHGPHGHHHD